MGTCGRELSLDLCVERGILLWGSACCRCVRNAALIIIIMYIYHVLINALSAHMIHINLNMIFYTRVEHSPTKTIYIKYNNYFLKHYIHPPPHTHTHTCTH